MAENYHLINADCYKALENVSGAACLLTDPPYGCTSNDWDKDIDLNLFWGLAKKAVKPGGPFILFCQMPFAARLYASNPGWFRCEWIYRKPVLTGFLNARKYPLRAHESIYIFCEDLPSYHPQMAAGEAYHKKNNGFLTNYGNVLRTGRISDGGRYPTSILEVKHENTFYTVKPEFTRHPTQKSVRALEYLIKTYTSPGDTVLDPFMGSGSTGVAAVNTGRAFIGIEREKKWFDVASKRLEKARRDNALLYLEKAGPDKDRDKRPEYRQNTLDDRPLRGTSGFQPA